MERADPMLAMSSSTGVVANSSSNALAVGLWDAQQLGVMSSSNVSPAATGGDTKPAPINPLLLASTSVGSWTALNYLLSKEDKQASPMVQPTQVFLDLLVGYPTSNSTKGRFTVQQASEDVENVVDQPASTTAGLLLNGVTAEGDTALHVVASHGDDKKFLKCAIIIFKRDQDLLFAVNNKGDTPLHCAARAGKFQMLSILVELAEGCNRFHEFLRKENVLKETALHDAVRIGNQDIVEGLLKADPDLANYPKEGTSPLYLAISLQRYSIARTLHDKSNGNLSYSGPHGQNALHAATFRTIGITKHILNWNNSLTTHGDGDGNTPLHFASVFEHPDGVRLFRQLLEANPSPVYQANNSGSFPIHVAATMGAKDVLNIILEKFPSSAGLRTAQGRTFLHVAIEKKRLNIVSFACQTPSLNWILNMQDSDGNSALHFAVKYAMFHNLCSLCGNMEVDLSLANNNKQTPIDLSRSLFPRGLNHVWNSDQMIYVALNLVGAKNSSVLLDHIVERDSFRVKPEDEVKEAQKMKEASQMLGIGSVLIATVSFGATFAVPGGFIADDHTNRGTPTLAGRYTFDAFMMANALAFLCSSIATIALMFTGSPLVNLVTRQINYCASIFFMSSSLTCLATAFALGVCMVLAPVANATGIAICVLSPLVMLYRNFEYLLKLVILARPLCLRMGLYRALKQLAMMMLDIILFELWPFVLIFGWAAIARKLRNL
ncbi:protein ACCELERATED CELL DEATH 6-like [Aegilops tauschii subsp. strangulata]|uniref:protein ACCELERATED CELL DEATH 6-like n=1 Tax=Aegilops tauschii subsp. strangulata TaxID=200361 RepID=UPI003CC85670